MSDVAVLRFLARAARVFGDDDWIFTGFHWPVLAMATARRLRGSSFRVIFEAGGILAAPDRLLPTSTTDYAAYDGSCSWLGSTADALLAFPRRYDRVVLDAGNVDVRGAVNSTAVGPFERPTVRLAGGGGAADAAAGARDLVLLHGRTDADRLVRRVEHVTAVGDAPCRLIAPWGVYRLGDLPAVEEWLGEPPVRRVRERLEDVGVDLSGAGCTDLDAEELDAAQQVLIEAADRGYAVARAAMAIGGRA